MNDYNEVRDERLEVDATRSHQHSWGSISSILGSSNGSEKAAAQKPRESVKGDRPG